MPQIFKYFEVQAEAQKVYYRFRRETAEDAVKMYNELKAETKQKWTNLKIFSCTDVTDELIAKQNKQ